MPGPSSTLPLHSELTPIKEILYLLSNVLRYRDKIQVDHFVMSTKTLEVFLEHKSSKSYARALSNPRKFVKTHAGCDAVDVLPMEDCCGKLEVLADRLQPISM